MGRAKNSLVHIPISRNVDLAYLAELDSKQLSWTEILEYIRNLYSQEYQETAVSSISKMSQLIQQSFYGDDLNIATSEVLPTLARFPSAENLGVFIERVQWSARTAAVKRIPYFKETVADAKGLPDLDENALAIVNSFTENIAYRGLKGAWDLLQARTNSYFEKICEARFKIKERKNENINKVILDFEITWSELDEIIKETILYELNFPEEI